MAPEKRPQDLRAPGHGDRGFRLKQDPHLDATGLRFETLDHGGEYPATMPQAIKFLDSEGRSCIYVPITQDGKVVDSQGYVLDLEDK
jgi:hypothetical protein